MPHLPSLWRATIGRGLAAMAALLALFWVNVACTSQTAQVAIHIEAKTNQGDPVAGASIIVDGARIGTTGVNGIFDSQLDLAVASRKRLEVRKESDAYYFAPYFENFVVSEASRQEINIPAVLYFVPKSEPKLGAENLAPSEPIKATADDRPRQASAEKGQASDQQDPAPTLGQDAGASWAQEDTKRGEKAPPPPAGNKAPALTEAAPTSDVDDLKEALTDTAEPSPTHFAQKRAQSIDEGLNKLEAAQEDGFASDGKTTPPSAAPLAESDDQLAAAPIILSAVDPVATMALSTQEAGYPKPKRGKAGPTVFTVHVASGKQALAGARVFVGDDDDGDLELGCETNARGRCVVRFPEKPSHPVTFVVSRAGYRTHKIIQKVSARGMLRVAVERGHTLDIYAVTKAYNFTTGLKDVEVLVGGKLVGTTDKFGHFSYTYLGKAEDLVQIALRPKGYLPETYETDFVASGPMSLVRYFSPIDPPAVRMSILAPRPAGAADAKLAKALGENLDRVIRSAARRHLFASSAFKEVPAHLVERNAARVGHNVAALATSGWQETDLKASLDAFLLPTVTSGAQPTLELSVIDSKGHVLAAASEVVAGVGEHATIERAIDLLSRKIARAFPFEGAILSKEADQATINIGYTSGRGIKAGDVLEVSGIQTSKLGRAQTQTRIATLKVREVHDKTALCHVASLVPRAAIERGDLVALRVRRAKETAGTQFLVTGNAKAIGSQPLAQANIYVNDTWIGATDAEGRLFSEVSGTAAVKVIKHGFTVHEKTMGLKAGSRLEINLRRETAFVRVDSRPSGLLLRVEGNVVGKTPLSAPVPVPAGFVKLELEAPKGYKSWSNVLELDTGMIDLSGPATIALERDLRAEARELLKAGRLDQAMAAYERVPEDHSDYLICQHELGELFLSEKDLPAKAAEAFARVTAHPAVRQFTDKRFIGSHIDEGLALFLTAEKLLPTRPEAAREHYKKSIEVLEAVVPHLRFVKSDQYAQAVHNVDYHRALARHKLWMSARDPSLLVDAVRTWRSYLDGSAQSVPVDPASQSYVEHARVYFKQAMASLERPADVSRQ